VFTVRYLTINVLRLKGQRARHCVANPEMQRAAFEDGTSSDADGVNDWQEALQSAHVPGVSGLGALQGRVSGAGR
jgi:hypothetical protein